MMFLNFTGSACREGEHKCGGQNLYLPQEALCNGINDCKDGSDEKVGLSMFIIFILPFPGLNFKIPFIYYK